VLAIANIGYVPAHGIDASADALIVDHTPQPLQSSGLAVFFPVLLPPLLGGLGHAFLPAVSVLLNHLIGEIGPVVLDQLLELGHIIGVTHQHAHDEPGP
jgi:hypothetical protein